MTAILKKYDDALEIEEFPLMGRVKFASCEGTLRRFGLDQRKTAIDYSEAWANPIRKTHRFMAALSLAISVDEFADALFSGVRQYGHHMNKEAE